MLRALMTSLAALLAACTPNVPAQTLAHGPFEIVATPRRISTGAWPNLGGNPFATMEVTDFGLRWRGRWVELPDGGGPARRFWNVLRLPDAPVPAVLLVERDFTLVAEQPGPAGPTLRVQRLNSSPNTLAEAQWLDSAGGQPGPSRSWGIAKVAVETDTTLQGGRWLRLGSTVVLDVQTLQVHRVEPRVPMLPGQPVTSLSSDQYEARAFAPGGTAYVLAGSQSDYARGRGQIFGLLVVDIPRGQARELRVQRSRMPFVHTDDFDTAWLAHYFEWTREPDGREMLRPRAGARPLPWRARLSQEAGHPPQIRVPLVRPAFAAELQRIVLALQGAARAADDSLQVGACRLQLLVRQSSPQADHFEGEVSLYVSDPPPSAQAACTELLREVARRVDAEFAAGRHQALLVLD